MTATLTAPGIFSGDQSARNRAWKITSIVLGLVLLTAAILKSLEVGTGIAKSGVLGGHWAIFSVVEFEVALGSLLLAGWYPRSSWFLAVSAFSLFSIIAAYRAISGAESCGCFGQLQINPWVTLCFDLLAFGSLLWCQPGAFTKIQMAKCSRIVGVLWAICTVVIGMGLGFLTLTRNTTVQVSEGGVIYGDGLVVLEPTQWNGKPFPLAAQIDIGERFAHGQWVIVLYKESCDHCQRALPRYEKLAQMRNNAASTWNVALVEMPPYGVPARGSAPPNRFALKGRLSDAHNWFAQTPVMILAVNGKVIAATEGVEAEYPDLTSFNKIHAERLR